MLSRNDHVILRIITRPPNQKSIYDDAAGTVVDGRMGDRLFLFPSGVRFLRVGLWRLVDNSVLEVEGINDSRKDCKLPEAVRWTGGPPAKALPFKVRPPLDACSTLADELRGIAPRFGEVSDDTRLLVNPRALLPMVERADCMRVRRSPGSFLVLPY